MNQAPALVSIVLPTLNGSRYIASSIESCLAQTYANFELIVVDGGSTDTTLDIVRSFPDPRIRIVNQPANAGRLPGALNYGFAQARGSLFTWTQDDDLYAPQALEVMAQALAADPQLGFVYAGFWRIDENGEIFETAKVGDPDKLYVTNPIGHCFLYRREIAERVGEYDPAYLMAEDCQFWDRVFLVTRMRRLPGNYFYHRRHAGSLTVRDYGEYIAARVAARGRRHVLKIPWLAYRRQVADAFIQEAFATHFGGAGAARVWRCVVQGVWHDPWWLTNRGVLSIGVQALAGQKGEQAEPRRDRTAFRPSTCAREFSAVTKEPLLRRAGRLFRQGGLSAVWAASMSRKNRWDRMVRPRQWARFGRLSRVVAERWPLQTPPVLVLSLPRSGSSWVGNTLGSAANAAYLREPLTRAFVAGGGRGGVVFDFDFNHPPPAYRQAADLAFTGLPNFYGLAEVVSAPSQWSLSTRRQRRLVMKEVNPYLYAWLSATYQPRIILLVRHPAAIALSYRKLGWWSPAPDHWERTGHQFGAALHTAFQGLQNMPNVCVAAYETLCAQPEQEFARLFDFAGLQWDARVQQLVREHTRTSHEPGPSALRKISVNQIDGWRQEIRPDELAGLRAGFGQYPLPWYQAPEDWRAGQGGSHAQDG